MNRFSTLRAVTALLCSVFAATPCARADDQTDQPPAQGQQGASTAAPTDQGLSIIVQSSQQTYASGDPIKVDVIVRNSSAQETNIGGSAFDLSSFRFVVLDPSSHPVKPT